jgi:hypothetical protein
MTEAFSFSVVIMRMDEDVQRMDGFFVREGMSRCPY